MNEEIISRINQFGKHASHESESFNFPADY